MKKVIGIFSVSTLALAMFMNVSLINKSNNNQSFSLASLLTEANAQSEQNQGWAYVEVTSQRTICGGLGTKQCPMS